MSSPESTDQNTTLQITHNPRSLGFEDARPRCPTSNREEGRRQLTTLLLKLKEVSVKILLVLAGRGVVLHKQQRSSAPCQWECDLVLFTDTSIPEYRTMVSSLFSIAAHIIVLTTS
jgi:hypothetical protein